MSPDGFCHLANLVIVPAYQLAGDSGSLAHGYADPPIAQISLVLRILLSQATVTIFLTQPDLVMLPEDYPHGGIT